jgi:hypothetical protein
MTTPVQVKLQYAVKKENLPFMNGRPQIKTLTQIINFPGLFNRKGIPFFCP